MVRTAGVDEGPVAGAEEGRRRTRTTRRQQGPQAERQHAGAQGGTLVPSMHGRHPSTDREKLSTPGRYAAPWSSTHAAAVRPGEAGEAPTWRPRSGRGVGRTGTLSLSAGLERPRRTLLPHGRDLRPARARGRLARGWRRAERSTGGAPRRVRRNGDFPACLFWPGDPGRQPRCHGAVHAPGQRSVVASASATIFAIHEDGLPPEMTEWFEMACRVVGPFHVRLVRRRGGAGRL